ncbi:MAG TPA: vWA domain-containing protein [Polyangia bacterium]|nr:vWA domain-containing protein [Polyangia bacterium]
MRLSFKLAGFIIAFALAGCSFKPSQAGQTIGTGGTGAGPSTGTGGAAASGAGGTGATGTGGGVYIGSGGAGELTGAAGGCGQTNLSVMPLPPDILLVQDRSLSMTDDSNDRPCMGGTAAGNGNCGATSKWSQVISALDPVIMQTQTTVNWGLMFLGSEPMECGANPTPVVPITPLTSYPPIHTAFTAEMFTGAIGTPTAAVLTNAIVYMQTLTDPNPKFLLLATDGEPNCAGGIVNGNDDVGAQMAVAAAKTAGFPTFVVGIATTSDPAASNSLNTLADTGGEAQTGAATKYYAVSDSASLLSALAKILKAANPCTIPLNGVNGSLDQVAVTAKDQNGNTVQIMEDPANGWSYTDPSKTAIVLNGSACDNLQSVTYTAFQFIYTCASGHICIDNCPNADAGSP